MFSTAQSSLSLANKLGVSEKALWCVEIDRGVQCSTPDCPFPALKHNGKGGRYGSGPQCGKCYQRCFKVTDNIRGHYFIGREFSLAAQTSRNACLCEDKYCFGLGYHQNMFTVPKSGVIRENVLSALVGTLPTSSNMYKQVKKRVYDSHANRKIAPWHFHPRHRGGFGKLGVVAAKKGQIYKDDEGKKWIGFPPPNYAPKKFFELETSSCRGDPKHRWATSGTDGIAKLGVQEPFMPLLVVATTG